MLFRSSKGVMLARFIVRPIFIDQILEGQNADEFLASKKQMAIGSSDGEFRIRNDGMLMFGNRMCVPDSSELKHHIMEEGQSSAYAMHPGGNKMYHTLRENFWWKGMKKDIAEFVSRCLTCQQVKIEHQRPAGLLQGFPIPVWKWEHITMDFVTRLPRYVRGFDSI